MKIQIKSKEIRHNKGRKVKLSKIIHIEGESKGDISIGGIILDFKRSGVKDEGKFYDYKVRLGCSFLRIPISKSAAYALMILLINHFNENPYKQE